MEFRMAFLDDAESAYDATRLRAGDFLSENGFDPCDSVDLTDSTPPTG